MFKCAKEADCQEGSRIPLIVFFSATKGKASPINPKLQSEGQNELHEFQQKRFPQQNQQH